MLTMGSEYWLYCVYVCYKEVQRVLSGFTFYYTDDSSGLRANVETEHFMFQQQRILQQSLNNSTQRTSLTRLTVLYGKCVVRRHNTPSTLYTYAKTRFKLKLITSLKPIFKKRTVAFFYGNLSKSKTFMQELIVLVILNSYCARWKTVQRFPCHTKSQLA